MCRRFAQRKSAFASAGSSMSKMSRVSMRIAPITAPAASSSANEGTGAATCAHSIPLETRSAIRASQRSCTPNGIRRTRSASCKRVPSGGAKVPAVKHIPERFRPALLAAALLVLISTVTRLALALRPEVAVGSIGQWLGVFIVGFAFDLIAACYLLAPLVLWLALVPNRLARTRTHRAFVLLLIAAAAYGALVLAVAEWLFWEEFGARFNFIAVDYLLYTHEVLANIWQSYPTGKLLVVLALAAVALTALVARPLWRWSAAPSSWRAALASLMVLAGLVTGATWLVD